MVSNEQKYLVSLHLELPVDVRVTSLFGTKTVRSLIRSLKVKLQDSTMAVRGASLRAQPQSMNVAPRTMNGFKDS